MFGSVRRRRLKSYDYDFVAVAGYFNPQIVMPTNPLTVIPNVNGDDAFIAVGASSDPIASHLTHAVIAGSGNERILGLAVDPVDQGVLVTGYFSSTDVDFDPYRPGVTGPPSYSGGTDIFVARYCWGTIGTNTQPIPGLLLDWLYTTGTAWNDAGTAVGVDVRGRAYATGWRGTASPTNRELWLAKIDQFPDCVPNTTTTSAWGPPSTGIVYIGPGDDAGLGLTVDGLDRVIVTGQFAGTVDFDPSANVDNKTSAGGLDLFVTRLVQIYGEAPYPIQYDGTFRIGGTYDEVGSAVAIEGLRSQRFAHVGWFGAGGSPNGYTLDFDPDSGGIANKSGNGDADAFVNSFLPLVTPPLDPSGIKAAVSLVLDSSEVVPDSPDYVKMMDAFLVHLTDGALTPQDGKTALNAVLIDYDSGQALLPDRCGDQVLPWTVIRPGNARVFARRLAHQPRRDYHLCKSDIASALRVAQASQAGDGIAACYRTILVVGNRGNNGQQYDDNGRLRAARDAVLGTEPCADCNVHQINAIAVRGEFGAFNDTFRAFSNPPDNFPFCNNNPVPPDLFYLPSGPPPTPPPPDEFGYLARSDAAVPGVPASHTYGLGLALHTDDNDPFFPPPFEFEHPTYTTAVQTMLKRSTRCPGDFNRDGVVNAADMTEFMAAYDMRLQSADWNLDGGLLTTSGCVNHININDVYTFNTAHALGCCGP